jgi:hypothetical protein
MIPAARPQTIQIFLPLGDPRGIRIAEITTRIVQLIEVPRPQLDVFLAMPPEFDSYARKCLFLLERTFKNATTTAPAAPAPLVFLSLRHEAPRSAPC